MRASRRARAGYTAADPPLMAWVLATLVDTSLVMHRRFVGPVDDATAEAYLREMGELGAWVGLDPAAMPRDLTAFRAYVEEMVATLEVTPEARQIARDLFAPLPETPWLSPAMPLVRALTAGLLPRRLREAYGLPWGPRRAAALHLTAEVSRTVLPRLPARLVAPPGLVMPQSWSGRGCAWGRGRGGGERGPLRRAAGQRGSLGSAIGTALMLRP